MVIVRENTEGEYSSIGGRMYPGTEREIVVQETVMSRIGVDRVLRYAFEVARSRPKKHLTSATKSNGIAITMPYWDERVQAMAREYPDVKVDQFHIDILTAHFVQRPDFFDVVVGSNLFGDILSTLAGLHRHHRHHHANLNPTRQHPRCSSRCTARHPTSPAWPANPIGQDLVRRHDARPPGPPPGARCGDKWAIEAVLQPGSGAPRTRPGRYGSHRRCGAGDRPGPVGFMTGNRENVAPDTDGCGQCV